MTDAAKEARNEYSRQYYKRNQERRKEYNKRYWERKAAEMALERAKTGENEHLNATGEE